MKRAALFLSFISFGLAAACGSFGSAEEATPPPPVVAPDAGPGAPDGAVRPDPPAPPDGGQGPAPGSFCAAEQGKKVPHVLCMDFESGITKAWRGRDLDDVFSVEVGTAQLSLGPGKDSPNALRAEAASVGKGTLTTTLAQLPSVRLSFALFVDKVPGAEGDAAVVALDFGSGERIGLRLAANGGSVIVSGAPALALSGVPAMTGTWRRIVLDVANSAGTRMVRVAIDDTPVLQDAVTSGALPSFPTSVTPHIGVDAAAVPFAWRLDAVTIDPVP